MPNVGTIPWRGPVTLVLAACLCVVSCGPAAESNASAPSDADQPSPRIACLAPAVTIMLRDVGALDHVVGRHAWDTVADPSIDVCGDQTGIDYESLLAVSPDVVITQWGDRELPARLREIADRRGWRLIDYRLLSLADVVDAANDVDQRFAPRDLGQSRDSGRPGRRLGDRLLDSITRPPGDLPDPGRILLLHAASPPAALGPGSFHHELLERMGLTPAIADGSPYMRLDAEDVLELAPDAIVLIPNTSPEESGDAGAITELPDNGSWQELDRELGALADLPIPAIERRRVAIVRHPHALIPSTSLAEVAQALAIAARSWSEGG